MDDDDFEWLNQWKWSVLKNKKRETWYAVRGEGRPPFRKTILMHRLIMKVGSGVQIDHRDRDGLHNWRSNLRACTNAENNKNKGLQKNSKTGYKGVRVHLPTGKYQARIQVNGKQFHIGLFVNIVDAARAYDKVAKERHGEFARCNFE